MQEDRLVVQLRMNEGRPSMDPPTNVMWKPWTGTQKSVQAKFEQMNERTVEIFNDLSTSITAPLSGKVASLDK
jgi:hypothetical protein